MTDESTLIDHARRLCDAALFEGRPGALATADTALDRVEAELILARNRVAHIRFLDDREEDPRTLPELQRALGLFRRAGDLRGEGEALFRLGVFHQVVRGDHDAASGHLAEARDLSARTGDKLTLSYVVRHLGFVRKAAGDLQAARDLLEESVRLREEVGHRPALAAAEISLAEVLALLGDREAASKLLDDALVLATDSGAVRVTAWLDRARSTL